MDAYPLFGREPTGRYLKAVREFEKSHPLVEVLWFDACSLNSGWKTVGGEQSPYGLPVRTVGWLLFHSKEGVKLSSMANIEVDTELNDTSVSCINWIPAGMVVAVRAIRGPRPSLEFGPLPTRQKRKRRGKVGRKTRSRG